LLINNLKYLSYSTGSYQNGKFDGITLQLICTGSNELYHVHFNAYLVRQRKTNKHKKGSPLPKGHFTVKQNSHFMKMWRSTCIPLPRSNTAFHDCIGKLKSITFEAELAKGTRLNAGTLRPMIFPDNYLTNTQQPPDKNQIITPDIDTPQTFGISGQEQVSTTCPNNYDISKQVSANTSISISPIDDTKRVQNQTTDEWLAEYDEQLEKECLDINLTGMRLFKKNKGGGI